MGQIYTKSGIVNVYSGYNFKGNKLRLNIGKYNKEKLQSFNLESILSLKIGPNTSVTLYEDNNLDGNYIIINNNSNKQKDILNTDQYKLGKINSIAVEDCKKKLQYVKLEDNEANKKNIMINDLNKPMDINHVDGLCVCGEMIKSDKYRLTVSDMNNIIKNCIYETKIAPAVMTESFGEINDIDYIVIIILILLLLFLLI
jgi:hypothetical protein